MLQEKLSGLLAEVSALEGKVQNLSGDFRTMQDVQRRLKRIRKQLTHLIASVPASVQPLVVVNVPPEPVAPPPPPVKVEPQPMNPASFGRLLSTVKKQSFADEKLKVIRTAANANHFLTRQVTQLLGTFSFAEGKLKCVRALKPRILDSENLFQLYEAFTFDADKKKLKEIIGDR